MEWTDDMSAEEGRQVEVVAAAGVWFENVHCLWRKLRNSVDQIATDSSSESSLTVCDGVAFIFLICFLGL